MSSDEAALMLCYAIIIGFPVGVAWLVNGVVWAVQIGTFACALHILWNQVKQNG